MHWVFPSIALLSYRSVGGFVGLKNHQFFQSVHGVWLDKTVLEPFTDNLRGSSELEHLVVVSCAVSARSIDNLLDCTSLKELQISEPSINQNILDHICKLNQVRVLKLDDTDLSPHEAQAILDKMKLKELAVSFDTFQRLHMAGFLDARLVSEARKEPR